MIYNSKSNFSIINIIYKQLFGKILSNDKGVDAEFLTRITLNTLEKVSIYRSLPVISFALKKLKVELERKDQRLEQTLFGCKFKNPIGLAAGFDKDGVAAAIWNQFGFGFAELGTVTWHAQKGNQKPRLFRLANEQAALNRMGFNNKGAIEMQNTLNRQGLDNINKLPIRIGLNFGKSKITDLNKAGDDYALSLKLLGNLADYGVINISSPNTPGLRELQNTKSLKKLINQLRVLDNCPPLFIKIAPDLTNDQLDSIAELVCEEQLTGIIAVNTSLKRLGLEGRIIKETGLTLKEEQGGLSGRPLRQRAVEVIRRLKVKTQNQAYLIGVGGIDSAEVAWERIAAGACLIQIYTGWIFQGPYLVPSILEGIIEQLEKHGFDNISKAVGSEAPWIE